MASIAVDYGFWNATEKLMDHGCLVLLGDAVESFLNNMATESIHAQRKSVATDSLSNGNYLIMCTMFEAALNEEITEPVDHQSIRLGNDRFDDFVLLFWSAHLELLLEKDGSLLIVVADDLVDDVFPVAAHVAVQQTTVVHRLDRGNVLGSTSLGLGLSNRQFRIRVWKQSTTNLCVPRRRSHVVGEVELVRVRR